VIGGKEVVGLTVTLVVLIGEWDMLSVVESVGTTVIRNVVQVIIGILFVVNKVVCGVEVVCVVFGAKVLIMAV